MKKIITLLSLFFILSISVKSQSLLVDTTFSNGVYGMRSKVWLPPTYYTNPLDSFEVIIMFPGLGEFSSTSDYTPAEVYGPFAYKLRGGWDGGITLGNGVHYPIYITMLKNSSSFLGAPFRNTAIEAVLGRYRIKKHAVHVTGLSEGGWGAMLAATYQGSTDDYSRLRVITSFTNIQGVIPTDTYGATPAYATRFRYFALYGNLGLGGKSVNFQQRLDGRDIFKIRDTMNAAVAGSSYAQETNYGSGGHSDFDKWYGNIAAPIDTFKIFGKAQNIYQAMLRMGDTTLPGGLTSNAGATQNLELPTSTTTLTGSVLNGTSPYTYLWTKVNGSGSITNPTNLSTGITGLASGVNTFNLKVTDNVGTIANGTIVVNVNYSSTDVTLTSNNPSIASGVTVASFTSTPSPIHNIISTKWTKLSGPSFIAKKIVFIGSSTTSGYGSTGYSSSSTSDSSYVGRVLNYYFGLGLISTKTGCNLGVSSTDIFDGQPSWYVGTGSQHQPLAGKNITAALALNPDIIIVNYPSNSYDFLSIAEVMAGFRRIKATADSAGKTIFITTTQPRTNFSPSEQLKLVELRDSILTQFPNNSIDFYRTIAEGNTSLFKSYLPFGDNIHVNDQGHRELAQRVIETNVFKGLVSTSSVIATPISQNTTISNLTIGTHKFQVSNVDNRNFAGSSISTVVVTGGVAPPSCNLAAPVTYTLSTTAPNEIYITNATGFPWKGGDTLNIPAGTYTVIEIDSFGGDPCRDIVIRNFGGKVIVNGPMRFKRDVHYVKVLGNGTSGITYGFKTTTFAFSRANHFTMERIEVGPNPNGVGIYGKQDPDISDSSTLYPFYVNRKITINNNYVHNVEGEGMYIGDTAPDADPYHFNAIPQRGDSTTISNNIVDSTGWDGIQLSNSRDGCLIFGNTVTNFGLLDLDAQRAGIISGGNTSSRVYNNSVSNGTGNGIQFFGYGDLYCYNNTISNVGRTIRNNSNGEENIYGKAYFNKVEVNPKQHMIIYGNSFVNPRPQGAIRFYDDDSTNNALPANIYNNTFTIPNALSNWQSLYFIVYPTGYININNILTGSIIQKIFIRYFLKRKIRR